MSILDTLITCRTEKDFYGAEDLNRVARAMEYVAMRLRACGWDVSVSPKSGRRAEDLLTHADAMRLLRDLRALYEALVLFRHTPIPPDGERPFDAEEANDIERILRDIGDMVQRTEAAYFYSGELYAGEV